MVKTLILFFSIIDILKKDVEKIDKSRFVGDYKL